MKRVSYRWLRRFESSLAMVCLLGWIIACADSNRQVEPTWSTAAAATTSEAWFINQAASMGLDFQHVDGRSGARYYVETAASGGGFLDYDQDGDLDIYLINGAFTPGSVAGETPRNALFENRDGRFVDVTETAGLGDTGYGMGICVGDVDGDGLVDIFLTNYGRDRLYRNLGNGRFEDWTEQAKLGGDRWGTGCAFGDIDGDGDLDLYVANYVDFDFENNPTCGDEVRGLSFYCRPSVFSGQLDYLYINQGNGRFSQEAAERGLNQSGEGKGFGVLLSDVDHDEDLDILVANDGTMNRFYLNNGQGVFADHSLDSGLGFNAAGLAESGMGMALGDIDQDGLLDLVVTNYSFESNTTYLQRSDGIWEDATVLTGLAGPTYQPVGWGVGFLDVENDGDLDLAVANGHVMDNIALFEGHLSYPQANLLLINNGQAKFEDHSHLAGAGFVEKKVSRGLAVGDVNNDGRMDLLITNSNGQPDLLINQMTKVGHWLGIHLIGSKNNRLAIGAKVRLFTSDKRLLSIREVRSGGSFLSQNDLRLHFGLGQLQASLMLEIIWADGKTEQVAVTQVDQYLTIRYE